ncbi:hypothetical protein MMC28_001207 [Mycoblastus sanguinarius]|nr:hypothetical protein [Mycoblastus sanguinarius]
MAETPGPELAHSLHNSRVASRDGSNVKVSTDVLAYQTLKIESPTPSQRKPKSEDPGLQSVQDLLKLRIASEDASGNSISGDWVTHQPMQNGWIRLVEIYPKDLEDPEAIGLAFRTVPLEEAPEYFGLSYTWGQPISKDHPITENLMDCLREIRNSSPGLYWIDALSINQEDHEEKSQQVRIMRSIYEKAKRVRIWLGSEHDDTAPATSLIKSILQLGVEGRLDYMKEPRDALEAKMPWANKSLDKLGLPNRDSHIWISLMKFFDKPYSQRAWVIQEVAVAKKHPLVMCGSFKTAWNGICVAMKFLTWFGWDIALRRMMRRQGINNEVSARAHVIIITSLRYSLKRQGLERLLKICRDLHATDPRDKITAVFGLASDIQDGQLEVDVDYETPVADYYRDITGKLILHGPSLSPLSLVEDHSMRKLSELPSWVPDYSITTHCGSRAAAPGYFANDFAAGNSPTSVRWNPGSSALRVHARIVDEVAVASDCVTEAHSDGYDALMNWPRMAASWTSTGDEWHWIALLANPELDSEEGLESFWRTIVGDTAERETPAPNKFRQYFAAFLLMHTAVRSARNPAIKKKTEEIGRKFSAVSLDNIKKYQELWIRTTFYRRFIFTKSRRMGLGPKSLQVGDQMTIFSGAGAIHMLRKSAENYRYVGEGYVHGLMCGEGLPTAGHTFEEISIE